MTNINEIETLRQRVAELEGECEYDQRNAAMSQRESAMLLDKLAAIEKERDATAKQFDAAWQEAAASQHYAQQLLEGLKCIREMEFLGFIRASIDDLISLPHDTSALDALTKELAEEKQLRRDIEKFYAGSAVDAKRYRWLRVNQYVDWDCIWVEHPAIVPPESKIWDDIGMRLDYAIDEAMK